MTDPQNTSTSTLEIDDSLSMSSRKPRRGSRSSFFSSIFRKPFTSMSPTRTRTRSHSGSGSRSRYEPPNVNGTGTPKGSGTGTSYSKNPLKRFKGFSTSISALFLDETVVCPSAAWCGILSSSRSEHFLHVRNQKRKLESSKFRPPSRIVGICLVCAVVGVAITYMIWGFGLRSDGNGYYGYNRQLEEEVKNDHSHYHARVPNIMRFKDYRERFWIPVENMAKDILFQNNSNGNDMNVQNFRDGHNIGNDIDIDTGMGMDRSLEHSSLSEILNDQELAYNIRAMLCVIFFLVLGIFGRRRRMKTRYAVLKARSEEDKVFYGANRIRLSRKELKMGRADKYDGACSHTICGCYSVDKLKGDDDEVDLDCMTKCFNKFSNLFCAVCCRMWVQCFSICALAQEARETRLLLPPKDQRVDYITHQPFSEYFKDVHFLRRSGGHGWKSHFAALSRLSRYILMTFVSTTILFIVTEQFNPRAIFSWADACVLIMTFIQSFVVLGIVHGIFHKSDLSLDAVIKFFGAGFIIATPMAFLVEVLVVNVLMSMYYLVALVVSLVASDGKEIGVWIYNNYKYFLVVADIVQAFLVAAASEEICKYYTFRSVEHPDLIFLTGLDKVKQDVKAMVGGGEAYPYSSNNASSMESRSISGAFESKYSDLGRNRSKNHRGQSPSSTQRVRSLRGLFRGKNEVQDDDDVDIRTVRQRAAAVTTAMISTAVGLACAENFIYVFFLSGSNTQEEITMLLFRSIFPVHALCAGMQSIGVIKKFLEEGDEVGNVGVGMIVLPAILLHGCFDSVLMLINSYIDIVDDLDDDMYNHYNTVKLNTVAACCVISVMFIGALWYWKQNRWQKARLKVLELAILAQVGALSVPSRVEDQTLELL